MNHQKTWRIDCQISPFSHWRLLIIISWLGAMLLIMALANLFWWQWVLIALITSLTTWFYRYNHPAQRFPVVHITQPPFNELYQSNWFIYVNQNLYDDPSIMTKLKQWYEKTKRQRMINRSMEYDSMAKIQFNQDKRKHTHFHQTSNLPPSALQLWQGKLISTYATRYLVVLHFSIFEPLPRQMSLSIWRDQVNDEAWRQLQVMTRL